jgi:hypothetical protein
VGICGQTHLATEENHVESESQVARHVTAARSRSLDATPVPRPPDRE